MRIEVIRNVSGVYQEMNKAIFVRKGFKSGHFRI